MTRPAQSLWATQDASRAGADAIIGVAFTLPAACRRDGSGGNDQLAGGPGADTFIFSTEPAIWNRDQIVDFETGVDTLLLYGGAHANLGVSGEFAADDARYWAASGAVSGHDADDRVVYDVDSGTLYYDADGSGAGAAEIIATFYGAPTVVAADVAVM